MNTWQWRAGIGAVTLTVIVGAIVGTRGLRAADSITPGQAMQRAPGVSEMLANNLGVVVDQSATLATTMLFVGDGSLPTDGSVWPVGT